MNHHQLTNLSPGTRLNVWRDGAYQKATFMGHIRGADPAAWIAFDTQQVEGRGVIAVKITTGLQFTPEYWEELYKDAPKFILLTEDELAQEVIGKMEVVR